MKNFLVLSLITILFTSFLPVGVFAINRTSASLMQNNNLESNIDRGAGGGVPVGTIIAWPVSKNPTDMENWLECNGQAVSSTIYPELFAIIGANVPDYRGYFLRGNGGNSAGLGIAQGDAIRNITGSFFATIQSPFLNTSTGAFSESVVSFGDEGDRSGEGIKFYFNASRVVPTAPENRPINKSVRYFIRAKP